ncbi:excalibur calcium-binding domain-containing protein [Streptomyces xanthophaeus]|uniref:excalibur calcium-binding domain-containing protein n=1 Tax=Streptomyces xanthophaeus TaxID=67385 RepID=UPI000A9F0AD4|nr:excalibur calcium-binding domain-containing protein [Streptomyces xanthophaeus]
MYPSPGQPPYPYPPAQPQDRRWNPAWAVPTVIAVGLFLPPVAAALAFVARWGKAAKITTVALASVWFLVLVTMGADPKKPQDDAKPLPAVTVTATVTAAAVAPPSPTPTPTPTPTPSPTPAPEAPASPTPPPAPAPAPEPTQEAAPRPDPDEGGASGSSATGGSGSVSYKNCTAARAAGAAPVRRGDPGYGRHLDRDGDGVACE